MQTDLVPSLALVLKSEGGYSNNPHDPGGATNYGITQSVYNDYRQLQGLKPASVKAIPMKEVVAIYKFQYWDQVRGNDLPAGVDYATFDEAANSGLRESIIDLQAALGFKGGDVDGHLGAKTLAAAVSAKDIPALIDRMCDLRLNFLHNIKHGTLWRYFGAGWRNRVASVRNGAHAMAAKAAAPVAA